MHGKQSKCILKSEKQWRQQHFIFFATWWPSIDDTHSHSNQHHHFASCCFWHQLFSNINVQASCLVFTPLFNSIQGNSSLDSFQGMLISSFSPFLQLLRCLSDVIVVFCRFYIQDYSCWTSTRSTILYPHTLQ